MMNCKFCEKSCKNKNSLAQHELRCSLNPERKIPFPLWTRRIGNPSWNKGLTKESDLRIEQISKKLSERQGELNSFFGKSHTIETKQSIGEKNSKNNKGGRCKWYEISNPSGKIFKVQGTWELKFTLFLNIIDDNWEKIGIGTKNHTFEWKDNDEIVHHYTPDFWSPKLKRYFEVKGYWWGNDKLKMEKVRKQNCINLEIITKKELDSYLKMI